METHRIHEGEGQGPHEGGGAGTTWWGEAGTTWWGEAETIWREGDNTDTPCEGHPRKHNKKKHTGRTRQELESNVLELQLNM